MRTHHFRLLHLSLLVVLALFLASARLLAQTDLGALRGHVEDQHGSAIAGATVTVRNPATAFNRTTPTDAAGNFSFAGIPLTGKYVVSVSAPQFKTVEKSDIQLRAAATATVDFSLDVAGDKTEINVYSTSASLPTESNQVSMRLDLKKIQDTPILNNKITSLPLLNSSVRPAQTTGDLFLNETLFVINGNGRRQTTYELDNTDADDRWGRQTMFAAVPFSVVQEFTVYTNASSAEWGRNAGTAVNLVPEIRYQRLARRFCGHGKPRFLRRQHSADHEARRKYAGAGQRNCFRSHRQGQDVLPGVLRIHQSESARRDHLAG